MVMVGVPVHAADLADAVEQSKGLKPTDFVDIIGEYVDGELLIEGVSLECEWPSEAVKK
ncbi:MAG: hypothetical protein MZV70_36295 [Desulfobacterales bacterium]|nr:hypothetical protein [Desulfobacterales bacterium]